MSVRQDMHTCKQDIIRFEACTMNLRNRSLLILCLTFLGFFIIIAVVSLSVTLSGLDRIEHQDMVDAVNQTQSALHAESVSILSTAQDWGWWDDLYQYAAGQNPGFPANNTDPDALATLHLNLFMILDEKGNPLFGQVLSPDFRTNKSVPADLETRIRSNSQIVYHDQNDPGISGILLTSEGPMMVASVPILRSDRTGPVQGTLIMGRYLEYDPIQHIDEITGFKVAFDWQGKAVSGTGLPAGLDRLTGKENLLLVADNESMITGYSLIHDLTGRDLVISVSEDRQLYRIGFANISTYLMLLALWAVITGIIVVLIMDRTVLQRMGRLMDHVRSLSGNREEAPIPILTGNDELAQLEKTIITSRTDLFIREQQLRAFVNAMPGPAALFSREGTVLLANPAFAGYLNKRPEEVAGSDFRSIIPPKELERYYRFVQAVIQKKEVVHFEADAGEKTFFISYYPVLGNDGEVIQIGILAIDISDRKRLENALQKVTKKIALLNTVIFSDIQNKVFVQMGYLELARQMAADPLLKSYLEREEAVVKEIQLSLQFAKQYNDMGIKPPRWQNVLDVMLFAVSHLELGTIMRDFALEGLEIYADSLLERVFVMLVENTIVHVKGATLIRAGYTITGDDAVIFVEDNGPGIAEDKKEEIFKKGVGTGGSASLFLSREILSITGITIRENGVFGKGARFEIRVPKGSYRFSGQ
jgi:PAS domain S-box-containing protein